MRWGWSSWRLPLQSPGPLMPSFPGFRVQAVQRSHCLHAGALLAPRQPRQHTAAGGAGGGRERRACIPERGHRCRWGGGAGPSDGAGAGVGVGLVQSDGTGTGAGVGGCSRATAQVQAWWGLVQSDGTGVGAGGGLVRVTAQVQAGGGLVQTDGTGAGEGGGVHMGRSGWCAVTGRGAHGGLGRW